MSETSRPDAVTPFGLASMSAAFQRALFEDASVGVFVSDAQRQCVAVNARGAELTGHAHEALIGRTLTDLLGPAVPVAWDDFVPGHTVIRQASLRRPDGSVLAVEIGARALPDGCRLEIVKDTSDRKRIEDALRFRNQAIDSSINAFAFADPEGRITDVNPAFLRLWGYRDVSEVRGRHATAFADSPGQVHETIAAVIAHDGWTGEVVALKSNGDPFVVELSASLVRDATGIPVALMASFIDVTERKRAQEALQASEEQYRSLVESAQDPIFRSDITGRYLYVNVAAAAMLGSTPDQVIGKTVDDLFPPRVAASYRAGVRGVIESGKSLISEDRSEINGRTVWFSSVLQPVRDHDGQVIAAQSVVREITSLKLAELALRESEERLRQAVRVSHIGIFDHDHRTDNIYQSPEHREIYGLRPDEELFGKDLRTDDGSVPPMLTIAHAADRERIAASILKAHDPAGDGVYEIEHRIVLHDGSLRWVTTRAQTFFEGEGAARRPIRTVGAVRDITESKLAEEEREKLRAQLVQAQKMESVGRLAGGVAHDFNNMLNVIRGYAELALEELDPAQSLYSAVEEIQKAAQRSADLTRQLLAFARRQPVAPRVLDLNDVVAASLAMLGRLIGEDVNLVWMPGRNVAAVTLDPSQLDQILTNLSANARDAITGVGQVTIRTENVQLNAAYCSEHTGLIPGAYVKLEVTDNGRGMDRDTQLHIFEPFYTTKEEGQGTGLGLATVYGIVKQNEGFVQVDSEVDRGTTVRIFLPPTITAARAGPDRPEGPPQTGTETVLLVEDEPMVLQLAQRILQRLGYTVLAASGPDEAIRLADANAGKIQLLLTDTVMPEMNGHDLAQQLVGRYPRLKCLFMSGYFEPSSLPRGVEAGIHFLQKPFSKATLAAQVRRALET